MEGAASSACLKASGVDKSSAGAPARTATPRPVLASRTRLSGFTIPSRSSSSIAASEAMSASKTSPDLIFAITTAGEPMVRTTCWPVSLLSCAAKVRSAFCTAPTLSTRMSVAPAMPASGISIAAIKTIRPKPRIVSSPAFCLWSVPSYLRSVRSSTHARPYGACARAAAHRHRADVRRGCVLWRARCDGKVSQSAHEHPRSGVGALYRGVLVPVHAVESLDPPRAHDHLAAGPADRTLGAPPRIDAVQLRSATLPPARRSHRAHILHALFCSGPVRSDIGRVGALAALD